MQQNRRPTTGHEQCKKRIAGLPAEGAAQREQVPLGVGERRLEPVRQSRKEKSDLQGWLGAVQKEQRLAFDENFVQLERKAKRQVF